jgi:hypothetical protein
MNGDDYSSGLSVHRRPLAVVTGGVCHVAVHHISMQGLAALRA